MKEMPFKDPGKKREWQREYMRHYRKTHKTLGQEGLSGAESAPLEHQEQEKGAGGATLPVDIRTARAAKFRERRKRYSGR